MESVDNQILNHFTSENPLDWGNDEHVRIVMACLVNAVYIIDDDNNQVTKDATAWYETFHFSRHENTLKSTTHHILGVAFKFNKLEARSHHLSLEKAPLYVVALRGTKINSRRDIKDCCNMASGMLYHGERVIRTVQFVEKLMSVDENRQNKDRIWWTGHSLGVAVTTCSIIRMNQNGEEYKPQTFLFNPPFGDHILGNLIDNSPLLSISFFPIPFLPIPFLPTISFLPPVSIIRYVLNLFRRPKPLHEWIPNLFVNPNDRICSGFIRHFENRKQILKFNHCWDYVKLLRLARLVKHHHTDDNQWVSFPEAHGILQWCHCRCQMECKTLHDREQIENR
ncbi:hypothetical protein ZOSMA_125G00010 [Zostera marina]|uniref:Uncharacterized protein n=1 Tax=Zostera marina TaxID=29655 RepID=A0A0K9PZP2_ZOSMR|nr:hypothetical protein ZOSMA_125G00010 [Zostera marina]